MSEFADARARERISSEFERSFFVEAAAGTGKTSELVRRVVGLIRSGAGVLAQIVAVTCTEKAAGEMKLRLRAEIEKARSKAEGEERDRLDRALRELELARIGTIHAFCMDVLHERPIEAGIDPRFEISAEDAANVLARDAFDRWLQESLSDPPEGVRRVLRRRNRRQPPREQLRNATLMLSKHRDFPTRWRRDQFDRDGEIDKLMQDLAQIGALARASSRPDDWLTKSLLDISRLVDEVGRREATAERDYD